MQVCSLVFKLRLVTWDRTALRKPSHVSYTNVMCHLTNNYDESNEMKILVFGPSGSGKTYVANELHKMGLNTFDADQITGLSAWYDRNGQKVPEPQSANEALNNHYSFLWSRRFLSTFLSKFNDVFIFGGSGNLFDLLDLFDRVYFLKINLQTQNERIQKSTTRNSRLDFQNNDIVIWGQWLEEEAKKKNIPFVDGTLSPKEIYSIISSKDGDF